MALNSAGPQIVTITESVNRTLRIDVEHLKNMNVKTIMIVVKDGTTKELTPEDLVHRLGLEW